jgi:hypothetical protein
MWTCDMSIGQLKNEFCEKKKNKKKKRARVKILNDKRLVRCVVWNYNQQVYKLIRPGDYTFENEMDIDQMFQRGNLHEKHLTIFKHQDPDVIRNAETPVYEACLTCKHGYFIKAQKCHLKQAYSNALRNDISHKDDILNDGTPYWVDRYVDGRIKARESKRRYDEKHKKQKV